MHVTAIIASGGEGRRFSSAVAVGPKQFQKLGSKPILAHAIYPFELSAKVNDIVLCVPEAEIERTERDIVKKFRYKKISKVVRGGEKRQDSVFNAIKSVNPGSDLILIHDGVRPFVTVAQLEEAIGLMNRFKALIFAVKPRNTIKRVSDTKRVENTIERETLYEAQTPQIFDGALIREAYGKAYREGFYSTDDSSLVERMGIEVGIFEGTSKNIKITYPEDLAIAKTILKNWSW